MPEREPTSPDTPAPDDRPLWARLHLWQMQPVRDVLLGLGVLALFWLGQKTSVVTVPLLLAILLAYLFEPVIQFGIRRLRLSRPGAVVGIIVGLVLVVVVPSGLGLTYGVAQSVALGSSLVDNAVAVNEALTTKTAPTPEDTPADASEPAPEPANPLDTRPAGTSLASAASAAASAAPLPTIDEVRENLRAKSGDAWVWVYDTIRRGNRAEGESDLADALESITTYLSDEQRAQQLSQAAAGALVGTLQRVLGFAATLFGLAFAAFVTMFFFFFLATGWVQFKHFVAKLLPDKHADRIVDLAQKFDRVIAGFVRGRLTIAFIQAIVFSVGYWIIGVPAAFILGPVVAILSIVPYLALVGLPISIGLLWLENRTGFRGNILWVLGAPTGLYFVGQALDDYVWTPLIQGKETGLDTPVILFASLAGGALFGVFGLLIAIPIAACVKILVQEIFWPKFKAWAEGEAADPLPIE
ncbi:MAG: AI-2E family transporter [Phycisphaerales bacterium]